MGRRKVRTAPNDSKGRLVEQIAAWLHEGPGIEVQLRVRLPTRANSRRKREIDILLTGSFAGYRIRMAVECKNEAGPIGAERIDAFVGKLLNVGIPPELGIYVSASGYTSGAVERANQAGIKPLVLEGLNADRLSATVEDALQSVVYVMLDVTQISLESPLSPDSDGRQLLWFRDETGKVCGSVFDLIWWQWMAGEPPSVLGRHELRLAIPPGWHSLAGEEGQPVSITATADVLGHVITVPGQAERYALVHAPDRAVDRFRVRATFDTARKSYPVATFASESDLETFLETLPAAVKASVGRIRLPRIRYSPFYWPPCERVARTLVARGRWIESDEVPDPPELTFDELEGSNVASLWEPIWAEHPAVKDREAWERSLRHEREDDSLKRDRPGTDKFGGDTRS